MKIDTFEDIIAWQKAKILSLDIYRELKSCKDYGFKDQIQRASISIMNNIAEGFERKGNKEFKQFLYIAKGSCGEVRSMLHLADKLGHVEPNNCKSYMSTITEISKLLSGLIKTL